jgi:hypothetical protein
MSNTELFSRMRAVTEEAIAYMKSLEGSTPPVPDPDPPVTGIQTLPVTAITSTTAMCGGNAVLCEQRGVCWSRETDAPELDSPKTFDGYGSGSFATTMRGLKPNTRYFVRAYAIINGWTTYGQPIKFYTLGGADLVDPTPPLTGVIVTDGDSRTAPYRAYLTGKYPIVDASTGGLKLQELIDRDVVNQHLTTGTNILVIWAGVNDFWQLNPSAQQVYDKLKLYCLLKKSAGWKVIVCTEVSIPEAGEDIDNKRWILNEMIYTNWRLFADGLADLGADPKIGALGAYSNTAYFNGIHLTDAGYRIVAGIVQKSLNSFFSDPVEPPVTTGMQRLTTNGHYFATEDGKPFFLMADTGWLMLYQLTLAEIGTYLDIRKAQGFNAVMCMLLSSRNAWTDNGIPANRNGDYPFLNRSVGNGMNGDPRTPNEPFWSFVDQAVSLAQSKGMYLTLLPVWGHAVDPQSESGWANESNRLFDLDEYGIQRARNYAVWLGNRYKSYPNIIWMLGGDRKAVRDQDYRPIWNAMREGLPGLVSFHAQGGAERSSTWFSNLSFNTFQSGHGKDRKNWILEDWTFGIPTLDSEPCYENISNEEGTITAYDVRKAAYRAVFNGAAGHTYGELNTFQFFRQGDDPWFGASQDWQTAINSSGAVQMGYLRRLIEQYPGGHGVVNDQGVNIYTDDQTYMLVYTPDGRDFTVDFTGTIYWFNPRTGIRQLSGNFAPTINEDWVLIIEKS